MQRKVLTFEQKFREIYIEKDMLTKKLQIQEKDFYDSKKAFQDEIERLKEREQKLEQSKKQLDQGLEEQRRANLDQTSRSDQKDKGIASTSDQNAEKELVLLSRAQKAEKQEEEMRSEKIIAIDEMKKLKNRILELEILVSTKDMEIESLKLTPEKYKAHYAKQIQDLNSTISELKIERNELQKKISEVEA